MSVTVRQGDDRVVARGEGLARAGGSTADPSSLDPFVELARARRVD